MINSSRLIHGIGDYVSARFGKYWIDIQGVIDNSTNSFNFWCPEDKNVGYKISFYLDEHKRAHFLMKVSDLEGAFNGIKDCIEESSRSNQDIDKTHYLNRKKISEERDENGRAIVEINCRIKTKEIDDEKFFYNTLWAYVIQPTLRCVRESAQKCEHEQKRKCA